MSTLLPCAYAVGLFLLQRNPVVHLFNFSVDAIWNAIWCECKHLSSDPVSSEDWRGSNVRQKHRQAPLVSYWRLEAFAQNPSTPKPLTVEAWKTPICLRLVRVTELIASTRVHPGLKEGQHVEELISGFPPLTDSWAGMLRPPCLHLSV